ncbi:GtrA family protein [Cohnella zeiphila]|uniref:GtrA family protein n=1 Tax=Cohnella zeiphila TaxID=2761120 RepID=A0A7X0VT62_9BACL|nr:GtrA family protein [Cohnella zeiphila]MBB6729534.1 GtrA family protein [Cohnella zeiphila]
MASLPAGARRLLSRRFLTFCAVGGVNTAVDVAVFAALTEAGLPSAAAQALSYACGTLNSYLMNRRWTFRDSEGSTSRTLPRFAAVNLLALALTSGLLALLTGSFGWPVPAGKAAATAAGLLVTYAGSSRWAFRAHSNDYPEGSDSP